jgi:hypothetical protein
MLSQNAAHVWFTNASGFFLALGRLAVKVAPLTFFTFSEFRERLDRLDAAISRQT